MGGPKQAGRTLYTSPYVPLPILCRSSYSSCGFRREMSEDSTTDELDPGTREEAEGGGGGAPRGRPPPPAAAAMTSVGWRPPRWSPHPPESAARDAARRGPLLISQLDQGRPGRPRHRRNTSMRVPLSGESHWRTQTCASSSSEVCPTLRWVKQAKERRPDPILRQQNGERECQCGTTPPPPPGWG